MNVIDVTFQQLKEKKQTALIPFITVGDPDLAATVDLIERLESAGADMIELGVPYSDPLADGPVIQAASQRALANQVHIMDCIQVAKQARERGVKLPFILFTYYNPVLQFGIEELFAQLQQHDISGIIIPDLPWEENKQVMHCAKQHGVHLVPLVAPTSKERLHNIVAHAQGFIYCVSSLGVTGVRNDFTSGIESFLAEVRRVSDIPIAIGFGISTAEHVERFSAMCDGVVVGSAIVKKIEQCVKVNQTKQEREAGLREVEQFVAALKG
ncbi:tryptophan synthase subunit alpha [Longirhabdus pacifica]|uniref:tryptophan synthase subunit alpha n=1 Tax=Longirhabdus pacifica TaxID=2305227 RepID=UPI00100877D4|nr:tryptophan synthase subunit alpha [Longirhabdus pacifica]